MAEVELNWNQITINIDDYEPDDLLRNWRWKVGDDLQISLVTSVGDLFLEDQDGAIHWLETGSGTLEEIAPDFKAFQQLLEDEDNVLEWFMPHVVGELRDQKILLEEDEIYSFKLLPITGGEYEPENYQKREIVAHFDLTGKINERNWQD